MKIVLILLKFNYINHILNKMQYDKLNSSVMLCYLNFKQIELCKYK